MATKAIPPRIDLMLEELPKWMHRGSCRDADPELFFPPDLGWGRVSERAPDRIAREMRAKELCANCPVRDDCLDYAMTAPEHDGLWGGLTAAERTRRHAAEVSPPSV